MARKLTVFGELIREYKDKKTNSECETIIRNALDSLKALPKV